MIETLPQYPYVAKRILVTDDHELVLRGIRLILQQSFPNSTILTSSTGEETMLMISQSAVDLVSVDLELPDMSGFNLIDRIRLKSPHLPILVNTVHDEIWTVKRLAERHVEGLIFKSAKASVFVEAVHRLLEGDTYYDPNARSMLRLINTESAEEVGLSAREVDVLRLIANGNNTEEIGQMLGLSPNTIETHRRHLLEKMDVRNSAELVRRAISTGILSPLD
ncbi:MAG: response regulator transcription factor [Bacteroidales bacterium]|nr:response regulator transcription factor [Bacteroidales bacterium]